MAESHGQTHLIQQYSCNLCSTVPLHYVLVMLTALYRPEKKDQLSVKNLCMYTAWLNFL